jgi:hypothetical protein
MDKGHWDPLQSSKDEAKPDATDGTNTDQTQPDKNFLKFCLLIHILWRNVNTVYT